MAGPWQLLGWAHKSLGWAQTTLGWALLMVVFLSEPSWANPDAKRLYDDLLSNYNRLIRSCTVLRCS